MNIMAILTVYFINPSHQSACLYAYVSGQQLGQNVTVATNTFPTIEELLGEPFSMHSSRTSYGNHSQIYRVATGSSTKQK
jgi:hypothetical protein